MSDVSPATVIVDVDGHAIGLVLDGSIYRLPAQTKVTRASDGAQINPATEDGNLASLLTVATAIRDTAGVKKIVDALPAGTNEIGKVAQGTKAAGADAWPQVLYDAAGNAVGVVLDGAAYRLRAETKIARASDGAYINPATQETLAAIKDTDGVKKIVDALPVGDNRIGRVKVTDDTNVLGVDAANAAYVAGKSAVGIAPSSNPVSVSGVDGGGLKRALLTSSTGQPIVQQGTRADASGGWPLYVVDNAGNVVGVVNDSSTYRLQVAGKIAKEVVGGGLVHLEAVPTVTGRGRLKTTVYTPDGDPVAFGATSSSIKNTFVLSGGSESLLVNGSVTPVVFEYLADGTYDISLQEIKFTLASNSITFGSNYFGATAGPLTNGLLVQVITGGNTVTIYNMKQNESFVNFASPGGFEWVVSSKDMMTSNYLVGGGLKLVHGTGDRVKVTVRDNISAAGSYFKCFVKGNLLTSV